MSSLDKQVGGNHYKKYPIDPMYFNWANKIPVVEAGVIKYVIRHQDKNGKEDLMKAIHLLEFLIEHCYPDEPKQNDEDEIAELETYHG